MVKKNRIAFFDADALTNQNAIATNSKNKNKNKKKLQLPGDN